FVDAGFCPRALVDALDDHGTGSRGTHLAVFHRLARQRPRHDHGIFGHFAEIDLAGYAVDDLGGGAEEHAHRQHCALAHDHAFGDFRARADEAVVLDDHGLGL